MTPTTTELRQIVNDLRKRHEGLLNRIRATDFRTCPIEELHAIQKDIRACLIFVRVSEEKIRSLYVQFLESSERGGTI